MESPNPASRPLRALREAGFTACGVVLMATPLALWVAWTGTLFLAVLGTGLVAAVLCVLLAGRRRTGQAGDALPPRLSARVLAEVSDLSPWIYHNRRRADPVFRAKLDRLKRHLAEDARPRG